MTSLSSQERTVIQTLLELNYSVRAIARFIKRSPSTVSIEIHQVTPYKAEIAHALALKKRHLRGRHDTLTPAIAVFLNHHESFFSSLQCSVNSCNLTYLYCIVFETIFFL
ncbi:transposase (plasmid) [Lactobacillus backii] [Leuconostoc pseudomesenteroides]|nr:transposase (plasmid) [Lactobacillus backii] [Leuconostoc pseudomesenteroides]